LRRDSRRATLARRTSFGMNTAARASANFLDNIFAQLQRGAGRVVLREIHGQQTVSVTGRQLLEQVRHARSYLRRSGLEPGDRCAILAPNSIGWAALDLALMAEGMVVVPLYSRAAPAELASVLKDSEPRRLFVGDQSLAERVSSAVPPAVLLHEVF